MSPDMSIMQTLDHFYSIWHRQPGDKLGRGLAAGKELIRRQVRRHSIVIGEIVEALRQDGEIETLDALVEHAANCRCFRCTGVEPPIPVPEPPDPLAYYQAIIDHGAGMISLGDGLGVFVGEVDTGTPAGWLFVPRRSATAEKLKHWVDAVRKGRADWPEKERL